MTEENTPQNIPHDLANDHAIAWQNHIIENPELIDLVAPVDVSNVANPQLEQQLDKQRAGRAASILRIAGQAEADIYPDAVETAKRVLGIDTNPYIEWRSQDAEGQKLDLALGAEFADFRGRLPEKIGDIEQSMQDAREKIFKILWSSGRNEGLSPTDHKVLEGWRARKEALKDGGGYRTDVLELLRLRFNHLPADEARKKTEQAIDRGQTIARLERQKQSKTDGVFHLKNSDTLIEGILPQIGAGKHVLIYGKPGIAKSNIARYSARKSMKYDGRDEEIVAEISVKPDTRISEIIGGWRLRGETVFDPGIVLQALEKDIPVSINEFNNADHDIQSVLERIMLLKPGEPFVVQQGDAKKVYTRGKGFCIIATANPDSKTTSRFKVDTAMRERFTGGIFEAEYPDQEVGIGDDPIETVEIIETLLADPKKLTRHLPNPKWIDKDVDNLAKITHWTQYLATHPGSSVDSSLPGHNAMPSPAFASEKPPLAHIVMSPRQMQDTIERAVADPTLSLLDALVKVLNAPDLREHRDEQKVTAEMLKQYFTVDSAKINAQFRL